MAAVSKTVLKSYFEDGKEPDENKFIDLIDTLMIPSAFNMWHTAWLNFPGVVAVWNTSYNKAYATYTPNIYATIPLNLYMNGGLTRNRYDSVPTWAFASSLSRYLSMADTNTLSFTGQEARVTVNDRGFSVGCWLLAGGAGNWGVSSMGIISKWAALGNLSYLLQIDASKRLRFFGSSNGTAYQNVQASVDLVDNKWYFCVGKFRTQTGNLELYVNGNEYYTTTGYTAIYDGLSDFIIGAYSSPVVGHFDGRMSGVFASGMHVGKTVLDAYYNHAKVIFEEQGVLGDPP